MSVAWVTEGVQMSSEHIVLSLAPWNKHDLRMRGLADRCVGLCSVRLTHSFCTNFSQMIKDGTTFKANCVYLRRGLPRTQLSYAS